MTAIPMSSKKRASWRQMDPFLTREQEKYGGRAAPSREFILQHLEERGMPLTLEELCAEWQMDDTWRWMPWRGACGRWCATGS